MKNLYTIGQLAKLAGISTKTLRVYERKGHLIPERNDENKYRMYGEEAVRTLEKIQLMKWLDFSLDQIAENMYLSPFYLSKIFKSETGDTPIHYLINIRMEKARKLLEDNRESSIQEVAAMVGYDDAYHFSKLFKKRYGVAPSRIRKL